MSPKIKNIFFSSNESKLDVGLFWLYVAFVLVENVPKSRSISPPRLESAKVLRVAIVHFELSIASHRIKHRNRLISSLKRDWCILEPMLPLFYQSAPRTVRACFGANRIVLRQNTPKDHPRTPHLVCKWRRNGACCKHRPVLGEESKSGSGKRETRTRSQCQNSAKDEIIQG